MADTKVSGLTAAASLLTTHEFPVNEAGTSKKVTGAQILTKTAQGSLGYAQVTANQTPITAQVDVTGLTVTTAVLAAGRRVRISTSAFLTSTVTTDACALFLMEGAVQLAVVQATGTGFTVNGAVVIQPSAAAHTYKIQAARVGTGNMTLNASVTNPAWILVEDIGV